MATPAPDLRLDNSNRHVLRLAMPISLAMLVPQINFITNNIFLGTLGEQELASAGITGVFYLIFAVIGNGLNNGLQALIARRAGQNKPEEIGKLFYHGAWVALFIAGAGILITYLFAPLILRSAIHNQAIAEQVIGFLLIRIWGLPFLYLYAMRNALLVGTNQSKFLVWGTLAEATVNIVLDYAMIYGHFGLPAMGFNGAAYASIVAEASGLIVLYVIIHRQRMHEQFSFFRQKSFDPLAFRLIMVQSSPLIAQYAISIATWEFFYILIEHHGERALAISNTMRNIFGIFGIFSWAFAATSNTMVSNLIGQGRNDEVVPLIKKIVKISFSISFFIFLVLNTKPEWFLWFYGQDAGFITEAIPVVRVVSVALLLMSMGTIWLNAITGTGNTKVNLMVETVTIILYSIYAYVVLEIFNMDITWGWASEWVYWSSMFLMSYLYIKSGKWKGKEI